MHKLISGLLWLLMALPVLSQTEVKSYNRPQEPKPTFPYKAENILFKNENSGLTLGGTLTVPDGNKKYPAVVLISGSGQQNRDEEIFGHKPFLLMADYLTKKGIAVFRYDDRGIGESEAGDLINVTTRDFATDAEAAMNYLKTRKEIDTKHIGLLGHSEGGIISFMLAAENKDVAFIVSLAGSGVSGDKISIKQNEVFAKAAGMPDSAWQVQKTNLETMFNIVRTSTDTAQLRKDLTNYMLASVPENMQNDPTVNMQINAQLQQLTSPWLQHFFTYDPGVALKEITCPVLALNGEKDIQVIADQNLDAIATQIRSNGNKQVTVKKYPDLNHLFQHAVTGMPDEYEQIEKTMSPEVLQDISDWILKVTK